MRQARGEISEHLRAALEFLGCDVLARPKAARGKAAAARRRGAAIARGRSDPDEQPRLQASAIDQLARKLDVAEAIDVTTCAHCAGAVRIVASIEDPKAIRAILTHFEKHGALEQAHYRPAARAPPPAA